VSRPRPRPRVKPPTRARPIPPPIVVAQTVTDHFGVQTLRALNALTDLMGGSAGAVLEGKTRFFQIPLSPQAGSIAWLIDHDMTIHGMWMLNNGITFGVSTSGMTVANFNNVDDGGILGMWSGGAGGLIASGFYSNLNWRLRQGQVLTMSKNQGAAIGYVMYY